MKTLASLTVFASFLVVSTVVLADKAKPDAVAALVAKAAPGAKKLKSFRGSLESPDVKIFPIKKGRCYAIAVRLGPGAVLEQASVEMDWPDDDGQQQPVGFGTEMSNEAGAVFKPDCATTNASVGVWVGQQTFDGIKAHGSGPYTIEIFERTASRRELAAEKAARTHAHAENERETDAHRAKTCGECAEPKSGRKVCLERRGVTMSDCGW